MGLSLANINLEAGHWRRHADRIWLHNNLVASLVAKHVYAAQFRVTHVFADVKSHLHLCVRLCPGRLGSGKNFKTFFAQDRGTIIIQKPLPAFPRPSDVRDQLFVFQGETRDEVETRVEIHRSRAPFVREEVAADSRSTRATLFDDDSDS